MNKKELTKELIGITNKDELKEKLDDLGVKDIADIKEETIKYIIEANSSNSLKSFEKETHLNSPETEAVLEEILNKITNII